MKIIKIPIPDDGENHYLECYRDVIESYIGGEDKCILDKKICGCGATSMFLHDSRPTVLCSPRSELLFCKFRGENERISRIWLEGGVAFEKYYLFRSEEDNRNKTDTMILKDRLKEYLGKCRALSVIPKILVTYDSAKHVIDVLLSECIINSFRFIVDEAQVVFTDAAFKGEVEMDFLENMSHVKNVVYLSATPFMREYMEKMPHFQGMTYYEIEWPERFIHYVNVERRVYNIGIVTTAVKIIEEFRCKGYFAEKIVSGKVVRATQCLFFLNNVTLIASIIKRAGIKSYEVDIICADNAENRKKVRSIGKGFDIGHARKMGEPHRTFTFLTKCSFEGVDLYHPQAFTYIFSDSTIDSMALDISIDLPQIMGRLRLDSNPFKYDAVFFYRSNGLTFDTALKDKFNERVKSKEELTRMMLNVYRKQFGNPQTQRRIEDLYRNVQQIQKMSKDYVTVVDDRYNGPGITFNELAMYNELRAWQVQEDQYRNGCAVMGSIDTSVFHVTRDPEVSRFLSSIRGLRSLRDMASLYTETLCQNYELKPRLEALPQVPMEVKEAFIKYGPDRLKAMDFDVFKSSSKSIVYPSGMVDAVKAEFPGGFYTKKHIKERLQLVYDRFFPKGQYTAKAKDITSFIPSAREAKDTINGKRLNGYQI